MLASRADARFAWVARPWTAPWPVLVLAVAGTVGAAGAIGDHRHHRRHGRPLVGPLEHRSHVVALVGGGLPLFFAMCAATLAERPGPWTAPVLALAIHVVVWVAYDAFVFHRRRRTEPRERALHAMTTVGNGAAFLAWVHWVWGGAS